MAQTTALFEESNRLQMTADATCTMQERLHHELDDRVSRQDRILQSIQTQPPTRSGSNVTGISSLIKKLLDSYNDLDESSKQALLLTAISSGKLQRTLFALCDDNKNLNTPSSL